jgi:hypothetical protein
MAVMGVAWQIGFIVGPAVGTSLLAAAPTLAWPLIAAVCLAAAGYALALERHIPERAQRTQSATGVTLRA